MSKTLKVLIIMLSFVAGSQNTSARIVDLIRVIVILLVVAALLDIYIECVKSSRKVTVISKERGDEAYDEYFTDNQGYRVQNVTASQVGGQQVSENDTQNTSDNTRADYADLEHYGNMCNYTGLSTQGNQTLVQL